MNIVMDDENLMAALHHVEQNGGQAVGVDGLLPSHMSTPEQWAFIRAIRESLAGGQWRQGELRRCPIPKRPGSQERRTIYIQPLADRVIGRALKQVLAPILDLFADDLSFARSGKGSKHGIASGSHFAVHEGQSQWIIEDLSNAFDRVPRSKLAQILHWAVPNQEVCELTLEVTKAPAKRGILQGSAVSPLLLNLYLDRTLHRPWRERQPGVPLLRYVDDLVVAAHPCNDLEGCYNTLSDVATAAGFELKHGPETAIRDISQSEGEWLGYLLRSDGSRVSVRPACYCSDVPAEIAAHSEELVGQFLRLHERSDGWSLVEAVVRGHVEHLSPSYLDVDRQAIGEQIQKAANAAEFPVMGGVNGIHQIWREAYERYLRIVEGTESRFVSCGENASASAV